MKIEIEVDGLKCKAETDYDECSGSFDDDKAAFERLCAEVRAIAYHLIDAKYSSEKNRSRI